MSEITLDQSSARLLRECRKVTLLRDPSGKVIGYFEPRHLHVYDEGEIPEFDEDELDRRVERWEGIPAEEVQRRLRERR